MTPDAHEEPGRAERMSVAGYRCRVADDLEALTPEQWEQPSWCRGWRVRDVLGHLVHMAEASQLSVLRDVIRHPIRPDRSLEATARRLGDEPVPTLARRLRQAAPGRSPAKGQPSAMGIGDVIVHGNDALRPLGAEFAVPPDDAVRVLNAYRRVGRLVFHARPQRHVRLVATDVEWSGGDGPEVRGRAIDLVMLVANRPQVVASLSGPGVPSLAA